MCGDDIPVQLIVTAVLCVRDAMLSNYRAIRGSQALTDEMSGIGVQAKEVRRALDNSDLLGSKLRETIA